jgi:hypothetical protein
MRSEGGRAAAARTRLLATAVAVAVGLGLFVVVACSSSSSSSPNVTPGQCVFSNGVWYCGGSYGNIPACPTEPQGMCGYDGGLCFACLYESAGAGCTCAPDAGTDGPNWWQCIPSGTGCKCPTGDTTCF